MCESVKSGKFDVIAKEVIEPVMQKIYEVAFDCVYNTSGDQLKLFPLNVKEGLLEQMDEVIGHLEERIGFFQSASIIAFACGEDGIKPVRKFHQMTEVAIALRNLIKVKDDQIKAEFGDAKEKRAREKMAKTMGF